MKMLIRNKKTIMLSEIDISCENDLLLTNDKVYGIIYEITNNATGLKYVGQTVSHRKNKKKFRPFGMIGRFKDHISEALNNTKRKQCSFLNNAIRKYGVSAFTVSTLEVCPATELNTREQHFIESRNTLTPAGYNLTKGGKTSYRESCLDITSLVAPKKRGGSTKRSDATRAKMSARQKERATDEFCVARSSHAKVQHSGAKFNKFNGCSVEKSCIESYIHTKGKRVIVRIDDKYVSFTSKHETIEQLKERARAFINELCDATLSNCGESVKPE